MAEPEKTKPTSPPEDFDLDLIGRGDAKVASRDRYTIKIDPWPSGRPDKKEK